VFQRVGGLWGLCAVEGKKVFDRRFGQMAANERKFLFVLVRSVMIFSGDLFKFSGDDIIVESCNHNKIINVIYEIE
jgi:hypothetical protein